MIFFTVKNYFIGLSGPKPKLSKNDTKSGEICSKTPYFLAQCGGLAKAWPWAGPRHLAQRGSVSPGLQNTQQRDRRPHFLSPATSLGQTVGAGPKQKGADNVGILFCYRAVCPPDFGRIPTHPLCPCTHFPLSFLIFGRLRSTPLLCRYAFTRHP